MIGFLLILMEKQKNLKIMLNHLLKNLMILILTKLKYATTLDFGKINTNWKFLN